MTAIEQLKAYHQAYKAALSVYRDWETDSLEELLLKYRPFRELVLPVMARAGKNWSRAFNLKQHVNCLGDCLEKGDLPKARSDIWTIVYCDMPELADYLLARARQAFQRREIGRAHV